MFVIITLLITITSDVLIRYFILSSFLICNFQGTLSLTVLSVIRNLNLFNSLITGKTSYHNSTALLTGLAAISCCSSVPVSMINCFTAADLPSFPEIKKLIRIFFIFLIWRPPTLPHRLQCSTIGRLGLNHRVRDGNGCVPQAHRHQKFFVILLITQQ